MPKPRVFGSLRSAVQMRHRSVDGQRARGLRTVCLGSHSWTSLSVVFCRSTQLTFSPRRHSKLFRFPVSGSRGEAGRWPLVEALVCRKESFCTFLLISRISRIRHSPELHRTAPPVEWKPFSWHSTSLSQSGSPLTRPAVVTIVIIIQGCLQAINPARKLGFVQHLWPCRAFGGQGRDHTRHAAAKVSRCGR